MREAITDLVMVAASLAWVWWVLTRFYTIPIPVG